MSTTNLAKTESELWQDIWLKYQQEHPGSFRAEDVVQWAIENDLADPPTVNPTVILKRKLKSAMRRLRIHDPQGRKVRAMLPAKVNTGIDENGNMMFDVFWDHVHEMSCDHVLLAFDQCDSNIKKQRRSATRSLHSCLDNNPNMKGHEEQFYFDFILEEDEKQVVEAVEETPPSDGNPRKPR